MSGVTPATTATVGGVLLDTAAALATPTGSALTIGLFATQDPGGITHRFDVRNYGARCDGITDDSLVLADDS